MQYLKRMEIQILLAAILAVLVGHFFPTVGLNSKWLGDLFLNLLKMIVPFLLFFAIFTAVLGLGDPKNMGRLGLKTVGIYMFTTLVAVVTIVTIMNVFTPGVGFDLGEQNFKASDVQQLDLFQFLAGMVPDNIPKAFIEGNAMQLVLLAFIAGFATLRIRPDKREDLFKICDQINDAILSFTKLVILLTPIGVYGLVASLIAKSGLQTILDLWVFVVTILIALGVHALIGLPAVALAFGKFNPFAYLQRVKKPIIFGFTTASSSATLPVSMSECVESGGVKKQVVDFVFPLGSTVNMDGTALYQAGVALFIAQALGVDLGLGAQITIVFATILASIGASGIPGAGIVMLTTVFSSVGLPIEAVAVIMAVDRFLDMFRTGVNVWGDLLVAKIMDRHYQETT